MGITIHYRGRFDDLDLVEQMEDRVTDLVFALGGRATLWRSFADHDKSRVVRGLLVEMAPGQETLSLLISPEGHLTPLSQIEDAEKTPFEELPFCFVKTQFGSITGHIAVVHLLDAMRDQYCSNMEIRDEGGYFENRDVGRLAQQIQKLGHAIESIGEGLQEYGLSDEAAEEPEIIARRIERIAMLVQQKIEGSSHANGGRTESKQPDDHWGESSLEDEVRWTDRHRRKNDLRSERMARRIAEATASGMSSREAFDLAMREEGLEAPAAGDDLVSWEEESQKHVSYSDSLPPNSFDEATHDDEPEDGSGERHPAVQMAQSFLMSTMKLQDDEKTEGAFISILCRGAMDMVGGLAQATCDDGHDRVARALSITQLKRAITGHAYARGAVFGLSGENAISKETADHFHEQLKAILVVIHDLTADAWDENTIQ